MCADTARVVCRNAQGRKSGEALGGEQLCLVWVDSDYYPAETHIECAVSTEPETVEAEICVLARVMEALTVGSACVVCGDSLEESGVADIRSPGSAHEGLLCRCCGTTVKRIDMHCAGQRTPREC